MAEMAPFFPCTAIGVMLKLGSFGVAKWFFFWGGGMALNAFPLDPPVRVPSSSFVCLMHNAISIWSNYGLKSLQMLNGTDIIRPNSIV